MLTSLATYWITAKYITSDPAKALWEWGVERGHAALRNDVRLRDALSLIPEKIIQSAPPIPELVIDVKFKHMQKLYEKRAEALEKGVLIQDTGDFVPASIRLGDQTTKVKLRLKGDHTDHLDGRKWSFRIHVKGKGHIFSMRRFSIQHPKVRGYQGEPLFFATLRHVGVLAPRYFFVDVTVNGNKAGVMAMEEHFSKEMLEASGRRDSPIIRFDESLYWDEIARGNKNNIFDNYQIAPIDAFGTSRIAKSEQLFRQHTIAVGLMRGFVNGELPPSKVFDVELMGRFLAVAQLWGSYHSMRWHNQRFYFNPITVKLEPIGFNAELQLRRSPQTILTQDDGLVVAMLKDPAIFSVFSETLRQLAREVIDGSLLEQLKETEHKYLATLQKEFYMLADFPYDELVTRANYLLKLSEDELKSPPDSTERYSTLIQAYLLKDDNGPYLEVANVIPHEVEIQSVRWVRDGDNTGIDFQPRPAISFPLHLSAMSRGSLPNVQNIYYQPLSDAARYALQVTANIQGQQQNQTYIAESYYPPLDQHPVPVSTADEQLSRHSFLSLDEEIRSLHVQQGQWQVEGPLVVPTGYSLSIPAGTTLQFDTEEGLIAHGPLIFEGSEEANIVLEGKPTEGSEGEWQGIAVLNAGSTSHWKGVTIRNTTGINRPGWQLTGGVNFYRSDIYMNHCRFQGNQGEDALNIVHSKFQLDDIEIVATASDAFDADFADGTVLRGLFQDIGKAGGGDAIDISGSAVSVTGTRFLNIYDKALSVGERSEMKVRDIVIDKTGTGAASKDGSRLDISNATIKQAHNAGLMAYIKKPEHGPARIEASNITFVDTAFQTLAQTGSTIVIDGKPVDSEDVDVEQLYKTVMKPGLR